MSNRNRFRLAYVIKRSARQVANYCVISSPSNDEHIVKTFLPIQIRSVANIIIRKQASIVVTLHQVVVSVKDKSQKECIVAS